jgi:hypothetical protein
MLATHITVCIAWSQLHIRRPVVRGAGSRVHGPRDVPHTFRNVGDDDLKSLIVYPPGGVEQRFINIAPLGEGVDLESTGRILAKLDYRERETG